MCTINIKVKCPHCDSLKVVKNGIKSTGKQNFLCKDCRKQFQFEYHYHGANPKVKKQIVNSLIHGNGIRDCSTIYKVSSNTVLNLLEKEGETVKIQPLKKHYECIEIDEMYSFVQNKGKKVWIFYAYSRHTGEILAMTMGKRTTQQVRYLMLKIKELNIKIKTWRTDEFKGFKKVLKNYKHLIGKEYTKAIEGKNCCVRARMARFQRRSTKFSKKLKFQWLLFLIFMKYNNEKASYN